MKEIKLNLSDLKENWSEFSLAMNNAKSLTVDGFKGMATLVDNEGDLTLEIPTAVKSETTAQDIIKRKKPVKK